MSALVIRNKTLQWGARTYVMGILNITPDSFSGDGLHTAGVDAALSQAREFLAAGCDILDVGGESTRPGAAPVSAEEEIARVIPVIAALRRETDALISIDTYKAAVAAAALEAGADIINDVWGFRADPALAVLAAQTQTPSILMHNRSNPASVEVRAQLGNAYAGAQYQHFMQEVCDDLLGCVALARAAGLGDDRIILDPGVGFGKSVAQNLELINKLDVVRALGFPVLLGPSRKSFIGYTLNLPPDQRVEGTAAAVAVGIARGADIIRVHDVQVMSRVAAMTDALVRTTV